MKALYNDGTVAELPEEEVTHVVRHSAAHIMAQAIKRLYPEADFAYGPATDNGFYYDVDLGDKKISEEDLPAIEAEMKKIVKEALPVESFTLPREEAIALMKEKEEPYKVELIEDLPEDAIILLRLYYYEGYNLSEIAQITGESENTVKSRHRRALEKLRDFAAKETVIENRQQGKR